MVGLTVAMGVEDEIEEEAAKKDTVAEPPVEHRAAASDSQGLDSYGAACRIEFASKEAASPKGSSAGNLRGEFAS